jgi:excinuclease ABC subunit A
MNPNIEVVGAREHNLKNINVSIPKNKLTVITGISGSGKSSLAFDTIHAEGQRRYMESFSAYARQFIGNLERPDVDKVDGLSPVIAIEQKTTNKSPRSTVGTVTEIYDFLRLLFARAGEAFSYNTGKKMIRYSEEEMINHLYEHFDGEKIIILSPVVKGRKGHYRELFEQLRKQGFLRVRIDGELKELKEKMQVDRYKIHDIEIVIDRLKVDTVSRHRLLESVQSALKHGNDQLLIFKHEDLASNQAKAILLSKAIDVSRHRLELR